MTRKPKKIFIPEHLREQNLRLQGKAISAEQYKRQQLAEKRKAEEEAKKKAQEEAAKKAAEKAAADAAEAQRKAKQKAKEEAEKAEAERKRKEQEEKARQKREAEIKQDYENGNIYTTQHDRAKSPNPVTSYQMYQTTDLKHHLELEKQRKDAEFKVQLDAFKNRFAKPTQQTVPFYDQAENQASNAKQEVDAMLARKYQREIGIYNSTLNELKRSSILNAKAYEKAWNEGIGAQIEKERQELYAQYDPNKMFAASLSEVLDNPNLSPKLQQLTLDYQNKKADTDHARNEATKDKHYNPRTGRYETSGLIESVKNAFTPDTNVITAARAEKAAQDEIGKYKNYKSSVADYIATNGLPDNITELPEYIRNRMTYLGLIDRLYGEDGKMLFDYKNAYQKSKKTRTEELTNAEKSRGSSMSVNLDEKNIDRLLDQHKRMLSTIKTAGMLTEEELNNSSVFSRERATGTKNTREDFENIEYLQKSVDLLNKAKEHKTLNEKVKTSTGGLFGWGMLTKQNAKNIVEGGKSVVKDPSTYDFGMSSLEEARIMGQINDKRKAGLRLNQYEQAYESALGIEDYMHNRYRDYEEVGGYMAGKVSTESLKFMAEMYAGSAILRGLGQGEGTVSGFARWASGMHGDALIKEGLTKAEQAATRYAAEVHGSNIGTFLGRQYAKRAGAELLAKGALSKASGDAMASMLLSNTIQVGRLSADIQKDMIGRVDYSVNNDGTIVTTGFKEGKSAANAIFTNEARSFTENYSEMMGEYGLHKIVTKPVSKTLGLVSGRLGLNSLAKGVTKQVNNWLTHSTAKEMRDFAKLYLERGGKLMTKLNKFEKLGKFNGFWGETLEEYYGNVMGHGFDAIPAMFDVRTNVSEQTKTVVAEDGTEYQVPMGTWEEISPFTKEGRKTAFDIMTGIALSTAVLGCAQVGHYGFIRHDYNESKANAASKIGARFNDIHDILISAHTNNLPVIASSIEATLPNAEQKQAFIQYYKALNRMRGASAYEAELAQEQNDNLMSNARNKAEVEGSNAYDELRRNDLGKTKEYSRQLLQRRIFDVFGEDIDNESDLNSFIQTHGGVDNLAQQLIDDGNIEDASTLLAYDNLSRKYDASIDDLEATVSKRVQQVDKFIDRIADEEGNVVQTTTKSGQIVYVKEGEYETFTDDKGKQSHRWKKDQKIVAIDRNGNAIIVNSEDLIDSSHTVVNKKQMKRDQISQIYKDALTQNHKSDKLSQNIIGKPYSMGNGAFGTILGRSEDGRIVYSVNDGNTETYQFAEEGATQQQLLDEWQRQDTAANNNEEEQVAEQQATAKKFDQQNKEAEVQATQAINEYIDGIAARQKEDLEKGNHFRRIRFTGNSKLDRKDVNAFISLITPSMNGAHLNAEQALQILSQVNMVRAEDWPRLIRLIRAYQNGNLTASDIRHILNPDAFKLSNRRKNKLRGATIDAYGNIEYATAYTDLTNLYEGDEEEDIEEEDEDEEIPVPVIEEETEETTEEETVVPVDDETPESEETEVGKRIAEIGHEISTTIEALYQRICDRMLFTHDDGSSELHQAAALARLKQYIQDINSTVRIDLRTGHNYFYEVNGKLEMDTRVHGVLEDAMENKEREAEVKTIYDSLIEVYKTYGYDAFVQAVKNRIKNSDNPEFNDDSDNNPYIQFLSTHSDTNSMYDVAEAISELTAHSYDGQNQSLTAGSVEDEISRMFFNKEEIKYDQQITVNGESVKVADYITEDAFNQLLESLEGVRSYYEDQLGYILIADRLILRSRRFDQQRGREIGISGETDMIGITPEGTYVILDFKTSKYKFEAHLTSRGNIANDFASRRTRPVEYDVQTPNGPKHVKKVWRMSQKEGYSRQLTMYNIMLEDSIPGAICAGIQLIPINISINRNTGVITKSENKRNQLNTSTKQYVQDQKTEDGSPVSVVQIITLQPNEGVLTRFIDSEKKVADDIKTLFEKIQKYISDNVKTNLSFDISALSKDEQDAINSNIQDILNEVNGIIQSINDPNTTDLEQLRTYGNNLYKKYQEYVNAVNNANIKNQEAVERKQKENQQNAKNRRANSVKGKVKDFITRTFNRRGNTQYDGILDSKAEDGTPLSAVINKPDFAQNAQFYFTTLPNEWKAYQQAKSSKRKKLPKLQLHIAVVYNGKTFSPVSVSSSDTKFYNQVLNALASKSDDQVVISGASVARVAQGAVYGHQSKSVLDSDIVSINGQTGINIYDIDLWGNDNTVGVIDIVADNSGERTIVVRPRKSNAIEEELQQRAGTKADGTRYQNRSSFNIADGVEITEMTDNSRDEQGTRMTKGTFVLMVPMNYNENKSAKSPVVLEKAKMSLGDVKFIINALTGKFNTIGGSITDGSCVVKVGKLSEVIPVCILDMVDMLIPCTHNLSYEQEKVEEGQEVSIPHLDLSEFSETNQVVKIVGRVVGDPMDQIPTRIFDLSQTTGTSTVGGINEFIQFCTNNLQRNLSLQGFAENRFDPRNMSGRGTGSAQFQNFHRLFMNEAGTSKVPYFQKYDSLQFGESCLRFDKEDFEHKDETGQPKPITGMGWYIKNGFLNTRYSAMYVPQLTVDEKAGVQITTLDQSKTNQQQSNAPIIIEDDSALDKRIEGKTSNRIDREKARKNLERIFGANGVPTYWFDHVLASMKSGAAVVGRCTVDGILLSDMAPEGTEYHEAFHRVLELLVGDEKRKAIYNQYRKAKKLGKETKDREIAEMIADEFMYYANNQKDLNLKRLFAPTQWKDLFKDIKDWAKMYRSIGSFSLYRMYVAVNSGKYANVQPTAENIRRFKQFAKHGLNSTVHGVSWNKVLNQAMYNDVIDFMVYSLLKMQESTLGVDGRGIDKFKLEKDLFTNDQFIDQYRPIIAQNPVMLAAFDEMLEHFGEIQDSIVTKLSRILPAPKETTDEHSLEADGSSDSVGGQFDDVDNKDEEDQIQSAGMDDYTKWSYESSQFSRVSQRVKFFFSGITKMKFGENGNLEQQRNQAGLPSMYDTKEVFYMVVNRLHEVSGLAELEHELSVLAKQNPMFAQVYDKFSKVYNEYKQQVGSGNINGDTEAFLSQLLLSVRCATLEFRMAQCRENEQGGMEVDIVDPDRLHTANQYVDDWCEQLAAGSSILFGQDQDGIYRMKNGYSSSLFKNLKASINNIQRSINERIPISIKGVQFNPNTEHGIYNIKQRLCQNITRFGLYISVDMLDEYLYKNYGGSGQAEFIRFMSDNESDINAFANNIATFDLNGNLAIDEDGRMYGKTVEEYLKNDNFIHTLANIKYTYVRAHEQATIHGAGGASMYTVSENNHITDVVTSLNKDDEEIQSMKGVSYNISALGNAGSILLKWAGKTKFQFLMHNGFKSTTSEGGDYMKMSKREDWIAKATILQNGWFLLPTMSDKKTYGWIDAGNVMPGFNSDANLNEIDLDFIQKFGMGRTRMYPFSRSILMQLREYAYCERQAIREQLDRRRNDKEYFVENANEGTKYLVYMGKVISEKEYDKLSDDEKKGVETHRVFQLGRYSSLLGAVDANGNYVSFNSTMDEDGFYLDEEANYQKAEEAFFEQREGETEEQMIERQLDQIREQMSLQVTQQLEELEKMGLITKESINGRVQYKNVGLDSRQIKQFESRLNQISPQYASLNHQRAIMLYVANVVGRHQISMQEMERIFSGRLSYYKWEYDANGNVVNLTKDWQKRLGGLVSTGSNNNTSIDGFDEQSEYVCAEAEDDYFLPEDIKYLEDTMRITELKSGLLRMVQEDNTGFEGKTDEEIADYIDGLSLDETIEELKKYDQRNGTNMLAIFEATAHAKSRIFRSSKNPNEGGVNISDGSAFISDTMCENLLRMVGAYSTEIQEAFKLLRGAETNPHTNKKYNTREILKYADAYNKIVTTVIGAQKYSAYGFRYRDGQAIPYYNKMALFPVFKCMVTGHMVDVYKQMKEQNIDMLMMHSAVKVGSEGAKKTDVEKLGTGEFRYHTYKQKYSKIRKQFNTDPKEGHDMAIGTQMAKVVMQALISSRDYNGVRGSQIQKLIMEATNRLASIGESKIIDEFFNVDEDGNRTINVEKVSKILTEELRGRGASYDLIDAVSIVERQRLNPNTGEMETVKETKLPLESLSSMSWIQSIIVSRINKKVVDINLPGHPFYQRSVWNMEGRPNMFDEKEFLGVINGGRRLKVRNEHGSMDCVMSIDYFDHLFKGNLKHASFEAKRKWLIEQGIIGGPTYDEEGNIVANGAKTNMVGYRIPTQSISSIHSLRCVDVIPAVRDTIILPSEFTTITGSDFDIDKLFIAMRHYKVDIDISSSPEYLFDEDTQSVSRTKKHVVTDIFDKETDAEQYYGNQLMDSYIRILDDEKSYNQVNGSIDNDTEFFKEIRKDLYGKSSVKMNAYDAFSMQRQVNVKDEFLSGKTGIGPFALNNNAHILAMLYKLKFKYSEFLANIGLSKLDFDLDKDGTSIMSHLSGAINAHVDVAKDPYISQLNVNSYTYNLVNMLLRTGLGKKTFYFTTQPIMLQLAQTYQTAGGVYMVEAGLSTYQAQKQAEEQLILTYAKQNGYLNTTSYRSLMKNIKNEFKHNTGVSIDTVCKMLFEQDNNALHSTAKGGSIEDLADKANDTVQLGNGVSIKYSDMQMAVYYMHYKLKPYAKAISDLVKYTKIDTKKQGKSVLEQRVYMKGYFNTFFSKEDGSTRLLFSNDIENLAKDSFIDHKTRIATDLFKDIMSGFALETSDKFMTVAESIASTLRLSVTNVDTMSKIVKHMKSSIKNKWFFDQGGYCDERGIDKRGLVVGNDCIYNRLLRLKAIIKTDPNYQAYRNAEGEIDNYLLNNLVSGFVDNTQFGEYGGAKFVKLSNMAQNENLDGEAVIQAWDEMLHDTEHPEIQKFARDLVVYSYLTSGDAGGIRDLCKYVPCSFKLEESTEQFGTFGEYMNAVSYQFNDNTPNADQYEFGDNFIEDVILNAYKDDDLIPSLELNSDQQSTKITTLRKDDMGNPDIVIGARYFNFKKENKKFVATQWSTDRSPMYFKTRRTDSTGKGFAVYKRVYVGNVMGAEVPIYVRIEPKGQYFKSGFKVLDYGVEIELNNTESNVNMLNEYVRKFGHYLHEHNVSIKDLDSDSMRNEETFLAMTMMSDFETDEESKYIPVNPQQQIISVASISDKTATNGVTIDTRLKSYADEQTKQIAKTWLKNNPNGIVAFRLSKDYATPQMAMAGAIGNPFNWTDPKYKDNASQLFMDWLISGNNFEEPLATEEYRQAIIQKLLSIDTPNILYYKELNKPSHATVLGYLINHKELLNNQFDDSEYSDEAINECKS